MSPRKSTNGRTILHPSKHRLLRGTFRTLEWIAPAAGAAWAEKIWFTLPPRGDRRVRTELPPGQAFTVELDGRAIRGTVWGSGPVVYLVHGWGGWGLQLAAYVPPLVAAGFRVVGYDAPSHGSSEEGRYGPDSTAIPEVADALRAVAGKHGAPHAVIGHSIGAAATTYAMRDGLTADRLVFVATAKSFEPTFRTFTSVLAIGPRTRRRLTARFVRRVGQPMEAFDVAGMGADLLAEHGWLPPLLAIHDTDDPEMPYQGSVEIVEGWPDAALRPTEGLGHRQALWHPTLVAEAVEFVAAGKPSTRPAQAETGYPNSMAG